MKRRRKSAKTKARDEARRRLRQYTLLRDQHLCQRCGTEAHGCNAHTSHVVPKGRHPRLEFDPNNVKLLCWRCHRWWHEAPLESSDWFRETWPNRAEYLDALVVADAAWTHSPITAGWYIEQRELLEELIAELHLTVVRRQIL